MSDAHNLSNLPRGAFQDRLPEAPAFDTAKRQQIMEGARRVFLEHGFDGASIGDIVRVAGVSKGTLYAYFPSKQKLFEALVIEDRRKQAEVLFLLDESERDVGRVLRRLGTSFLDMLIQPETLAFFRIVVAASAKFPEIGKTFYEAGPCVGAARLGTYLSRLDAQGTLSVPEPELAARQFLDLCKTGIYLRMLLGHTEAPSREEMDRTLDSAIKVFLAAYGLPR